MIDIKKTLKKVVKFEEDTKGGEKSKKLIVSSNSRIIYKKIEPFSL